MIYSIRIDDETIDLVPAGPLGEAPLKVFNADSMTLLVGPNGSGKTTYLYRIAEAVLEKDPVDVVHDSDLSNLRVVFLTLSPFGKPKLNIADKRLRVQFRGQIDEPIVPDVGSFNTLAAAFKLPAKAQLRLGSRTGDALAMLRRAAESVWSRGKLAGPARLVRKFEEVKRLHADGAIRKKTDGLSISGWFETPEYMAIKIAEKQLERVFEKALRAGRPDDLDLHLRAISLAMAETRERERALRFFLGKLGLEVSQAPKYPAAERRYEAELNSLRTLGEALEPATKDKYLRQNAYEFSPARLGLISEVKLGHYGKIELAGSSSGMAALFAQFSMIQKGIEDVTKSAPGENDLLLLIDEGDVFLHIEWQQQYVNYLNSYVSSLRQHFGSIQVVLTTHSPVLMSDFPRDHIQRLRFLDGEKSLAVEGASLGLNRFDDETIVSFGAPLESIIRYTGGAGTIGAFAAGVIEGLIERARKGEAIPSELVDMIDDPVLRRLVGGILLKVEP